MPLIKTIRGAPHHDELARTVAERLRRGFIREPHVAIEVETYRPFFILGRGDVARPVRLRPAYDGGRTRSRSPAGSRRAAYRWDIQARPAGPGRASSAIRCRRSRACGPATPIIVKERWF